MESNLLKECIECCRIEGSSHITASDVLKAFGLFNDVSKLYYKGVRKRH